MLKEGDFIAQPKLDGHNALIFREGGKLVVLSRHMKKLAVSPDMLKRLELLPIEEGTVLNAEWTCRRKAFKEEQVWLFDMMYERGDWIGTIGAEERYGKVEAIYRQVKTDGAIWPVYLVPAQDKDYGGLYRKCIDDMVTEGIVLKKKTARLIGDLNKSAENPNIFKLKWRDGADGLTRTIVPDADLICAQ